MGKRESFVSGGKLDGFDYWVCVIVEVKPGLQSCACMVLGLRQASGSFL